MVLPRKRDEEDLVLSPAERKNLFRAALCLRSSQVACRDPALSPHDGTEVKISEKHLLVESTIVVGCAVLATGPI